MAENNHLENRTMQLVKRVESLLNNLPEQGEPLEARKLKHIISFNESLAKELESVRAESQEKLSSISEKETCAARARDEATQKSRLLSQETEQLRQEAAALKKNQTESLELGNRLREMMSAASSERSSLEKEQKNMGPRVIELTKNEEVLRAGLNQLERDKETSLHEIEQARAAHENRVKEYDARILQQRDELEQNRLTHEEAVRGDRTRAQELSGRLDEKEGMLNTQAEEIARQRQDIAKELQAIESERAELSTQSARVSQAQNNLEAREKAIGEREERLHARQEKVKESENQCKAFVTGHNSQVDLFNKTCKDYMDKQKQIDKEKEKVNVRDGVITAVDKQLREEQQTARGLRARLGEAESKLAAQEAEMKAMKQTSAEKGRELSEILGLLQGLNVSGESMNSTREILRESTESVKKLEGELSSKLEASEAVGRDLEAAHADIDRLNKDVAARCDAITGLEQQVSSLTQQKSSAEQQVSALEQQISAVEQAGKETARGVEHELSERKKEINTLRDEMTKLQRQVQNKTTELSLADAQVQALERDLQGEKEKNKSMAHFRTKYNVEEGRHKSEIDQLNAEHQDEIQRLKAGQDKAIEALEAKHAREIKELEGAGHSHQQRSDRRSLPLLTPSTTWAASFYRPQATEPSEWQQLLDLESAQDDEGHGFLRSIEPSIAYEDSEAGNFSLEDLLPHVIKMAQNPAYRERFEAYLESGELGWFCFVLVGKLGHSDKCSRPTQRGCSYNKHRYNCIQVRLQEDNGPRNIEFRNFEVE